MAAGILPDATGWAVIAYTAIFPSILSQVFYIRGVELIGANRAGLFINLVPIFGTLLSILDPRRGFPRLTTPGHGAGVRRHLACRDQQPEDSDTGQRFLTRLRRRTAARLAESIDLCARTCASTSSGNGASR